MEKKIFKERQQTRHDVGREKFVAEVKLWTCFVRCMPFCR